MQTFYVVADFRTGLRPGTEIAFTSRDVVIVQSEDDSGRSLPTDSRGVAMASALRSAIRSINAPILPVAFGATLEAAAKSVLARLGGTYQACVLHLADGVVYAANIGRTHVYGIGPHGTELLLVPDTLEYARPDLPRDRTRDFASKVISSNPLDWTISAISIDSKQYQTIILLPYPPTDHVRRLLDAVRDGRPSPDAYLPQPSAWVSVNAQSLIRDP